jgi:polyisoprenoid-binding protein YceI
MRFSHLAPALHRRVTRAALIALCGLGAALGASSAARAQQSVLPAQSEIAFTSRQMGVPVDGKFKSWDAQLSFDPKRPEVAKVAFSIQTGSVAFGAAETDAEVVKAPWFNVAKFPTARFQSTAVKAAGPGRLLVSGTLSIKGQTQPVSIPVVLSQAGATTTASGSFAIKRLDFQIGDGEWADTSIVANDVMVRFKLAVQGVAPL